MSQPFFGCFLHRTLSSELVIAWWVKDVTNTRVSLCAWSCNYSGQSQMLGLIALESIVHSPIYIEVYGEVSS